MSDYRDIEKEACEKGILLDKCGLIDRYYDFGSYQDFCGMTPQEILDNMRKAGQGGGGGDDDNKNIIIITYKDNEKTSLEKKSAKVGETVLINIQELVDYNFINWEINGVTGITNPIEFIMPDENYFLINIYYEMKTIELAYWGETNRVNLDTIGKTFTLLDLQNMLSGSTDQKGKEGIKVVTGLSDESKFQYIVTEEDMNWYTSWSEEEIDDLEYYNYLTGASKYFIYVIPSQYVVSEIEDEYGNVPFNVETGYIIDGINYTIIKIKYADSNETAKSVDEERQYVIDPTYWNRFIGTGSNITKEIRLTINNNY